VIVAAVASYFTFGAAYAWAATSLANAAVGSVAAAQFIGAVGVKVLAGSIAGAVAGFVGGGIATGTLSGAFGGAALGAISGGLAGGVNPYGKNMADAMARSALGIAARRSKVFEAMNYLYVGARGSVKAIAHSLSTPRNIAKTAGNYFAMKRVERFANKRGMELWEFNLALTVNSIVGRAIAGSTITKTDGKIRVAGFFNRTKYRRLGAIWDVNDLVLGYQGLPDAIGYEFISEFRGQPIYSGHSLGALRASNLVALGFASSANIHSLPFGNISPTGTTVFLGELDFVNGFFLGGVLNPTATLTPCVNGGVSGSFCHRFNPNYVGW
jgi:hypothetical protein